MSHGDPLAIDGSRRSGVPGLQYSTNQRMPGHFEPRETERSGDQYGNVAAVDPVTGDVVWLYRTERPMAGGALATAGGLVFAGRTSGWFELTTRKPASAFGASARAPAATPGPSRIR